MANEVEKKQGVFGVKAGMVNTEVLKQALSNSASLDPRGAAADGSVFMNFSGKRGAYEIGVEKRDTDTDELWLINSAEFEDGWICWKGGRVMASRMVSMGQPVPVVDTNEHGPFTKDGDGWYQAKSLIARSLDNGEQVYFKINSKSGVSVFAGLQKEISQRIMAGRPYWPVVSFGKEKFSAQGYANFKPVITVDGWLADAQVMSLASVFEDENAELDLGALYADADEITALPTDGEKAEEPEEVVAPKQTARRNRRQV